MRNILSLIFSRLSPNHRILRWELPRLLAAIERLQISIARDIASDKVRHAPRGTMDELKLSQGLDRLNRQVEEINISAQRIRDLLGY